MRYLVILGLALLSSDRAFADSDGNFCASNGYLAYELREWSSPDKKHVLNIVRVGSAKGISDPVSVLLSDFQLHGLSCEPTQITLVGWETTFVVELPQQGLPRIESTTAHEPGQIESRYSVHGTLTDSRRSESLSIPSTDRVHTYELEVLHEAKSTKFSSERSVVHHNVVSKIVKRDLSGKKVQEKLFYQGTNEEPIH